MGQDNGKKNHIYEKFGSALISKVKLFGKVESNFVFPKPKNKLKRQSCFNFSIKKKRWVMSYKLSENRNIYNNNIQDAIHELFF